ncbi:MAG: hypothetical protein AB7S41_04215 [Parvibaculaceae bacterium]
MDRLIQYLDGLKSVGDALIGGFGTIVAAVLGALIGVLTYIASARREAAEARKERHDQWLVEESRRANQLDDEVRLREERIDDFVRAIHAEIITGVVLYEGQMPLEEVRYAIFDQTPLAVPDETDFVFETVRPELTILPSTVIHSVVAYYRMQMQTNLYIRKFRSADFRGQSPKSKRLFMEGYIQLLFVLKQRAEEAVQRLEKCAGDRGYGQELIEAREALRESTARALAAANGVIEAAKRSPEPVGAPEITRPAE